MQISSVGKGVLRGKLQNRRQLRVHYRMRVRLVMERARSTKCTFGIRFPAAIVTDELRVFGELFHLGCFPGLGKLTHMHFVVFRVGAEIVYVFQSVAHLSHSLFRKISFGPGLLKKKRQVPVLIGTCHIFLYLPKKTSGR